MAVVAALQSLSALEAAPPCGATDGVLPDTARCWRSWAAMLLAGAFAVGIDGACLRAGLHLQCTAAASDAAEVAHDGQMLVQAVEVDYDYNNNRVARSATCSCSTTAPASKPTR